MLIHLLFIHASQIGSINAFIYIQNTRGNCWVLHPEAIFFWGMHTWRFLRWIIYECQGSYSPSKSSILLSDLLGQRLPRLAFTLMEVTTCKYHRTNGHQLDRQRLMGGFIPCSDTWLTLHALRYISEAIIGLLPFHSKNRENSYHL